MRLLLAARPGTTEDLSGLIGFVADVIVAIGAPGVGLFNMVDQFFPPIPSELFLPFAGFLANRGEFSLWSALAWATLGALLGSLVMYGIGAKLGRDRTRRLLDRLPIVDDDDLDSAEDWFDRHGRKAVMIGRCVPGVRSFVSLPAGIERMPLPAFLGYTLVGTVAWNALLIGAGWLLGRSWQDIGHYSDWFNYAIYAAFAASVATFVWRRRDRLGYGEKTG